MVAGRISSTNSLACLCGLGSLLVMSTTKIRCSRCLRAGDETPARQNNTRSHISCIIIKYYGGYKVKLKSQETYVKNFIIF
jgi:hypothetical protein